MTMPAEGTILILTGMGIPLCSLRGARQTLVPIKGPAPRRSVNRVLYDTSTAGDRLYASEITCTDLWPLSSDVCFPGTVLTVECVNELWYPSSGSPARPVVTGSARTSGSFIFYRPILTMMVMPGSPSQEIDEYSADVVNKLSLEEVGPP